MKAELLDLRLQDARQQEAASLGEVFERWLDDGGASDNEAAYEVGVGSFSPLLLLKPEGGLL
ncbi:MAG: hypothetical protein NVS3B14_08810 [Ktedonobacteraceae bacterium]